MGFGRRAGALLKKAITQESRCASLPSSFMNPSMVSSCLAPTARNACQSSHAIALGQKNQTIEKHALQPWAGKNKCFQTNVKT